MTFTEWYKYASGEEWEEEHTELLYTATWLYELYCKNHGIEEVWDG